MQQIQRLSLYLSERTEAQPKNFIVENCRRADPKHHAERPGEEEKMVIKNPE